MISVAIDGPASAGKSSVSKFFAKKLNFAYLDTGALYRLLAYFFVTRKIDYTKKSEITKNLKIVNFELKFVDFEQKMFLFGEDVSEKIRTNDISSMASTISAILEVREYLLNFQRDFAKNNNTILDGRDIGTVVLPNADIKIFLTATPEIRASRRFDELIARGEKITYTEVLKSIKSRDYNDTNRKIAPLVPAKDATIFDTSNYNLDEVIEKLLNIYRTALKY